MAGEADRDKLVAEHWDLVAKLVTTMCHGRPDWADRAAAESAAGYALLRAAEAWDPEREASFRTYATYRIRYAVIDEWRRTRWGPQRREGEAGRPWELEPVEYGNVPHGTASMRAPDDEVLDRIDITQRLATLEPQQVKVITEIYFAGRTAEDVATEMGLHYSRVSQIKKAALAKMRRAA